MNQTPDAPGPEDNSPLGTPAEQFADATWDQVKQTRQAEQDAGVPAGETPEPAFEEHDGPQIIDTTTGKDGIRKCLRCGSGDVIFNVAKGMLACQFCRFEWQEEKAELAFGLDAPISQLRGRIVGSGSEAIIPGTNEVLTFGCNGCGAEVVIDTNDAMQARCHWCRQKLSVGQQLPNGAVPDVVLPFSLPREEAVKKIGGFVKSRRFFANRQFKAEFKPDNVLGVYLPYFLADFNAQAEFRGKGEHTTREYTVNVGDDETEKRYDYDVHEVGRTFSIYVDDLSLESAADKKNTSPSKNTNNIINSIMPFDTKNAVLYNPNYLSGFSSQKRDLDIDTLFSDAQTQAHDIGRYQMIETIKAYDRGVRWDTQKFEIVGDRWVSAYLPVWLYSYLEKKSNGKELLHYIAVNGRTGETMGSVPINMRRLWIASGVAEVIGLITATVFFWV